MMDEKARIACPKSPPKVSAELQQPFLSEVSRPLDTGKLTAYNL
jgi:hypothetical protein